LTDFTVIISPGSIKGVILPLNTIRAFADPVKNGIKELIRNTATRKTIAVCRTSFSFTLLLLSQISIQGNF
jgi:hypothetical protein